MTAIVDRRLANLERRVFKPSLADLHPELAELMQAFETGTPDEQDQLLLDVQEELERQVAAKEACDEEFN